jgi:hypothetical protein
MAEPTPPAAEDEVAADASATGIAAEPRRAEGGFSRRRRHRRSPRPGETGAGAEGQAPSGSTAPREASRPPRNRYHRAGEDRAGVAQPERERTGTFERRGPGQRRQREAGGLAERGPDAGSRARRERHGRGARGRGEPRGGPSGRGRDAPRQVEQKLYALEAMVDRGFEDVPDEAEESGSRRVHWVIVKRTVADQKSGKAMSATYVLQRDGGETEFPNLGAARAAANKTIVHPEKLTMSKAEHAAAKGNK